MTNKLKRRFVDLTVGEVSLVDSPANEEEFVVVKRLLNQEEKMADKKKEVVEETQEESTEKSVEENDDKTEEKEVKKVELEVEDEDNESVTKAMDKVVSLVEGLVKTANKAEPKEEKTVEKVEDKEDASKETEEDTKTEKSEEKPEDKTSDKTEEEVVDEVEKTLELLEEGIKKARRFTPKREEALKSVVGTLQSLLVELSTSENKSTTTPGGTSLNGSGLNDVSKSIGELVKTLKTQFEEQAKTSKSLSERIEVIEKVRRPSNSVEDEGGTDKEETVKKGLWSGVL